MGFGDIVTKPYHWTKSAVEHTPDAFEETGALLGEGGMAILHGGEQLWDTFLGGGGQFLRIAEIAILGGVAIGAVVAVARLRAAFKTD